ncbi:MAG: hypothetical protein HXY34_12275 [Candidatus Thorarchaeota archaeon]|nr:hypothetical protein [Candidatus Thorarchaeota archaeon]
MPDWMMTRVVVVLIAVLAPFYFFLLMFILPFRMTPFGEPLMDLLFHQVLVPSVFSLTWVASIYIERYRLANTVHLMRETTAAIPLRWRVFYGTNAAFVLVFFILPLATPVLSIIGGLLLAGTVIYRLGVGKLGVGKIASAVALLVALVLCLLPILIMVQFIPNYLQVGEGVMEAWSGYGFAVTYGVSQCLVNALSFGAPLHFIYFAAQEYDRGVYGVVYTSPPVNRIRILEAVLFMVFTYTYLPTVYTPLGFYVFLGLSELFTNYINYISLAIVGILLLVKWRLRVRDNSTMGGAANVVVVALFLVVEVFFKAELIIVTLVVWLAFIIFAAVILANFMRASPREMY